MKRIKWLLVIILVLLFSCFLFSCDINKPTEGLQYTMLQDGTYSISGYTGDSIAVNIPSKYRDVPVTAISSGVFAQSEIQSISGGANIRTIGGGAFWQCYLLKSCTIKGPVEVIGESAFSECTSLTHVKTSNVLRSIGYRAFWRCKSLETIELPDTMTSVDNEAFCGCGLTTIDIPESVTSIGAAAFCGCGLTTIDIPESVTSIGASAFMSCGNLTTITIPSSVTSLGESIFAFCDNLTTITIPSSVTHIQSSALCGNNKLSKIIYQGTKKQWLNVKKNNGWDKDTLNYTVHCTDGCFDNKYRSIDCTCTDHTY